MRGTTYQWTHHALFCAMLLLAGCASLGPQLPLTASPEDFDPQEIAFGIRTLNASGEFEVISSREVARRLRASLGERPLGILALSSGGASGAFGAGALVGAATDGAWPEFSVVTGVSSGALLAPFAFLGPSRSEDLRTIFTEGMTDGLLQTRGLSAIFGSSLYSDQPLRKIIERYADDALVGAVATEAAKGRLLLVATTDFATGESIIWDIGSIALHGGSNAKPLFQTLLLASASIPGMLPPVIIRIRIQGRTRVETHVDGGVTQPFFIAPLPEDLLEPTDESPQRTIVRVIIDGSLRNVPRPTHSNALSIFSRSVSAGLSHATRAKLQATVAALQQRGIPLEYAAIPASYPHGGVFDFSPAAERSLFEYAAACARTGHLLIHARTKGQESLGQQPLAHDGPACPAEDSFIGRLAALRE